MPRGTTVKTPERVVEAQCMRAQGMLIREIAAHFGISMTALHTWLVDPNGSRARARKNSYRGACVDCGAPTDGSNGKDNPSERCRTHAAAHGRKLGKAYVIASIQEWAELFGDPPSASDWNRSLAIAQNAAWRVTRYEDTGRPWPSAACVQYLYGTWNNAIKAAGYQPLTPGQRRGPETHRQALLDHRRKSEVRS